MARRKKVRWGHMREIDGRLRVGTANWQGLPRRLRHLSAWRRMHKLAGGHMPVRMHGTRHKVRPSSNLRLTGRVSKMAYIKKRS